MSNTLADITRIQDLTEKFWKNIRPKSDQYHNAILKRDLTKNKYGDRPNEHQQRDLQAANGFIKEIASDIESEASVFCSSIERIIGSMDLTDLSVTQAKLFKTFEDNLDGLKRVEIDQVSPVTYNLGLEINAVVDQIRVDASRDPRNFARKPSAPEDAMEVDRAGLTDLVGILGDIKKSADAFGQKNGQDSSDRVNKFLAIENERINLLKTSSNNIKHAMQFLQTKDIDQNELNETIGNIMETFVRAYNIPSISIDSTGTSFAGKYDFAWVPIVISQLPQLIANNRRKQALGILNQCLDRITNLSNLKISDANKVSSPNIEKIISDNEDRLNIITQDIRGFFEHYTAIIEAVPKTLYSKIDSIIKSRPSVSNKDEDKIWSDYKSWYDKLEESILDLIDFTKMYMGIKMLYPFTVALRKLDSGGKDSDTQAYVRAMQTLLNEALDAPAMPSSKKALIAELYRFYPTDRNIAFAYNRVLRNV